MNALFYLFRRKLDYTVRRVSVYLSYEPDSEALSEKFYGLYIVLLLLGWTIVMLALTVSWLGNQLAKLHFTAAEYDRFLFLGLGGWLALTPWLVYRGYDLYKFDLADLDFLDNVPLSPTLVTLGWWGRSLFKLPTLIFTLICGIIASTVSYVSGGQDWVALGLGLAAGAGIFGIASGFRWLLGLLRYRPGPTINGWVAYGSSGVALGILVFFPWARVIFWPAALVSWLVTEATGDGLQWLLAGGALAGLVVTLLGLVFGLYRLARTVRLAPAFEEGKLGGQYRLLTGVQAGAGGLREEASLRLHLGRRYQQNQGLSGKADGALRVAQPKFMGVAAALFSKQWLRFQRLPISQTLPSFLILILVGAGVAVALATQMQAQASVIIFIQIAYLSNWGLLKLGVGPLRRELSHPDFFVSWPISRLRLMSYCLIAGFGLLLVSGEAGLLVAGLTGLLSWSNMGLWLTLWGLLVAFDVLALLFDFQRQLKKWSASPENIPNVGTGLVLLVGVVWLFVMLSGLQSSLFVAAAALLMGYSFLSSSRAA